MARHILFKDEIIIDKLIDTKLQSKILNCLEDEKKNEKGRRLSNVGSFQTDLIFDEYICSTLLQKVSTLLVNEYGLKNLKIRLDSLWINENKKNDFNAPHNHPKSNFSGVYYISESQKGGELLFLRNDTSVIHTHNVDFIQTESFFASVYFKPEKYKLIIFPSHLTHMVQPHTEEGKRVSVSFNINLHKK